MLLNGNHAHIKAWRRQQSLLVTARMRPDMFEKAQMTDKERSETLRLLEEEKKHDAP